MRKLLALSLFTLFFAVSFLFGQTAPPVEKDKREADLVELIKLEKTIKLDIRYAGNNNFVGRPVYTEARAFLQRPAAQALVEVHKQLRKQGLGLAIFDGYRPWSVTKLFWEVTPEDKHKFVADPKNGSRHNRGCAVDLTIYDLKTGKLLPMPSDFDDFSERASPKYLGGTPEETANRELLRKVLETAGFTVNADEWWHFDYKDWREYGIYDLPFSEIRNPDLIKGFRVRQIEFHSSLKVDELQLRHAINFSEGDIITPEKLEKSISGINKLRKFDKISEQDLWWKSDKSKHEVEITFFLNSKTRS